jgi:putative Mn2+ efflux pump MntP
MLPLEIFLIALALAMDAFAVSVVSASTGGLTDTRSALRLAFHLGLFQALMPILGWAAGSGVAGIIAAYDHWVAAGLLTFIGMHLLRSATSSEEHTTPLDPSRGMMLVTVSIASSIDALAVGISMAMLQVRIWLPAIVIGLTAGWLSLAGILFGTRFSQSLGRRAEFFGGLVMFVIAARILIEHLGT